MNPIAFRFNRIVTSLLIVSVLWGGWSPARTAPALPLPGGPKPVVHITYYVDAVSGDDENNGTSTGTAWKTLGRIRQTKYGPGNKILLHRGQSWSDQTLYIGNSRDELETYLSGFSAGASTHETMTNLRNADIPELTYGTIDQVASLDLAAGSVPDSMVELGSYGDPGSPNPIVKNVMLHWTTGIYIHGIEAFKNGTEYTTIVQHDMNIVLQDYVTPGMYTDTSENVRLKDVLSETSQEHGLYLCDGSTNFIIEDSTFRNNTASGIQTNGVGMNPGAGDTTLVKRSAIYDNRISGYNDVRSRNMIFYRNWLVSGGRPGDGKAVEVMANSSGNRYYHNVFVSKVAGIPAVGMGDALNTFVNNIFYVQNEVLAVGVGNVSSDYNSFYAALPANHLPTFNWGGSFALWKIVTGEDAHSLVADPQFVSFDINGDPANWDLHLKSTSPLIDQGVVLSANLGESYTFNGSGPDIGAYEFAPSLRLSGFPADRAIYLAWSVEPILPVSSTWQIDYYTQTVTAPFSVTGISNPTRFYGLTGLTNYQTYTVTLSAMLGATPVLSDTLRLMPSDRIIYLPWVGR